MISLKNKVAIITGGSRGIGAATAVLFARAGADVVINYKENETRAKEVAGKVERFEKKAFLFRGDIARQQTASVLLDATLEEFNRVDIVVNNAGIWTFGRAGEMNGTVWKDTIETNLTGVFNVCNAVIPYFKENGGGKIINISSTAGQRGEAYHSHYAASKAGILGLTKSLAAELGEYNILVNAIAPGWVDTELNKEVFSDDNFFSQVVDAIPLKKIATAEDVAGSVLFLASDLANHVTGATINVNGGGVLV